VSAALATLIDHANRTGRPPPELVRHHVLEAVLRRVGGDTGFALRGSMLTRIWAAPFPRPAADLDFAATAPLTVAGVAARLLGPLDADAGDEVRFLPDRCGAEGIWEQSAFPGVRLTLSAEAFGSTHTTTADVGFGDPLVPSVEHVEYPVLVGPAIPVWAVHPATLIGWKLHGLAEWGPVRWRPKDLLDLWLLTARFELAAEVLGEAIRVAFVSRGYDPTAARCTIDDPTRWGSPVAQARWAAFRRERGDAPVPPGASVVAAEIAVRLEHALNRIA
jgi:hypothetical protein